MVAYSIIIIKITQLQLELNYIGYQPHMLQ